MGLSMRRNLSILAVGLMFFVAACSEDGLPVGTNAQTASADAPTITAIDQKDLGNGFVGLTAKATDPKNRALTFNWRVDNGQLSQATGRAVTWKVPTAPGDYTATLEVKNDSGAAATATQRFTVSQTGQVQAQGTLQIAATTPTRSVNGQFVIPSPLNVQPNPPIVGGNPAAPTAAPVLPGGVIAQPVATPQPGTLPVPTAGPLQPIATAPPTTPPEVLPPSPFPSPSPATPEPGVPVRPPVQWVQYNTNKVPTTGNWKALHFTSPTRGWIAGGSGEVLFYNKTGTDEPALERRKTGIPSFTINAIHFVSDTEGFIVGPEGFAMRTADAGVSWQDISLPKTLLAGELKALVVTNKQIVTVGDALGRVFRNEGAFAADTAAAQAGWVEMPAKPPGGDIASGLHAGTGFPTDPTLFYFAGNDGVYRLDTDHPDASKRWRRIYQNKQAEGLDLGDGTGRSIKTANAGEVWYGTSGGALIRIQGANTDAPTATRLKADQYFNREHNGNGTGVGTTPDGRLTRANDITAMAVLDANNAFLAITGAVYDTNNATVSWRGVSAPTFDAIQIDYVVENNQTTFRGFGVASGSQIWQYKPGG